MKDFTAVCTTAIAALLLSVCLTAADPRDPAQALKDNEAQWNRDFVAKDADKLLAHYAGTAVLMAPGMPPSSGTDAIRRTLAEMLKDPKLSLKFQASRVEVSKSGDLAFTQGSYTMTMTDPAHAGQTLNDHGSYVTVYRRQGDGSWKAVSDIATSEAPPPTGK